MPGQGAAQALRQRRSPGGRLAPFRGAADPGPADPCLGAWASGSGGGRRRPPSSCLAWPRSWASSEPPSNLTMTRVGVVYQARQQQLKRLVALKMIRAGLQARPEDLAVSGSRRKRSRGCITPISCRSTTSARSPASPLSRWNCWRGSLADRLAGTPQPGRQAAELMVTLARAIAHGTPSRHRASATSNPPTSCSTGTAFPRSQTSGWPNASTPPRA